MALPDGGDLPFGKQTCLMLLLSSPPSYSTFDAACGACTILSTLARWSPVERLLQVQITTGVREHKVWVCVKTHDIGEHFEHSKRCAERTPVPSGNPSNDRWSQYSKCLQI